MQSSEDYFKHSVNCQLKYFKALLHKLKLKDTYHVFEVGCGTGTTSAYLAKEIVPNGAVTACDPVANRIQVGRRNFSTIANLEFIHATGAESLKGREGVYDAVVSNAVLHWINDEELVKRWP